MNRFILVPLLLLLFSCNSNAQKEKKETFPVSKTDAEWRAELTDMEYLVLRKNATELAWSSPLNDEKQKGVYTCAGCGTPLFKSEHKFDSGSGWPSFDREIKGNVAYSTDNKLGYTRTEEHCANCGGHLGHVFPDGPRETTGLRHCINGVALDFIPEK